MIDQIELEIKTESQPFEEKNRPLVFSGVKNFRYLGDSLSIRSTAKINRY
jgi:hypothetical protein